MRPLLLCLHRGARMNHTFEETCCFTGHRARRLPWGDDESDPRCAALKARIYDAIESLYEAGVRRFICGMAMGSDTYFAEAVLRLREKHPDVCLTAAIPCLDQAGHWRAAMRRRYEMLCAEADEKVVIASSYTFDCMERRNRYMVENSKYVLMYYTGGTGGTFNTARMALKMGRELIDLT